MTAAVLAVHRSGVHQFSKATVARIDLLAGLGVEGDAHNGVTVKHRSRVARDPTQPNLRQVHLLHAEILAELAGKGFDIAPGAIGENITTTGIDLLALPTGARLQVGATCVIEVTGLRNPCVQLDQYRAGLMAALLDKSAAGELILKAGVMGIVLASGPVVTGDCVTVELPALPHRGLVRV
jgi:MOSC domain-containing protein YiiM